MERKERIMELHREGYSTREIAMLIGLKSHSYVHRIITTERNVGTV